MNNRIMAPAVILLLIVSVVLLGAQFRGGEWLAQANKPTLDPPPWMFALGWTVFWAVFGAAAWLGWDKGGGRFRGTHALGVAQLLLVLAWSWLFFGLHRPGVALAAMTILVSIFFLSCWMYFRLYRPAAPLMAVALAWLAWMWIWNFVFWWVNGGGVNSILN